jgi:hypothetical protein
LRQSRSRRRDFVGVHRNSRRADKDINWQRVIDQIATEICCKQVDHRNSALSRIVRSDRAAQPRRLFRLYFSSTKHLGFISKKASAVLVIVQP